MFLSVLWLQLVRMISNILIVSNGPATLLESCSCSFEVSILLSPPKLNTTFMIMPLVEVGIGFQFQYNPSALKDFHLIPITFPMKGLLTARQTLEAEERDRFDCIQQFEYRPLSIHFPMNMDSMAIHCH